VSWYPRRRDYFAPVAEDAEIEQGDVFWGVPTLAALHPELADAFREPLRALPAAETLEPPPVSRVLAGVVVRVDPVVVLPHTCDFYGPEKGRTHRDRLVGRVQRLADAGIADPRLLRSGEGYNHTFFLPSWVDPSRDRDDMFVNMRQMTTVDAAYLSRQRRLARLSEPAVVALRRRITYFFTDYAPALADLLTADAAGQDMRRDRP
jgi:hypothetical protein